MLSAFLGNAFAGVAHGEFYGTVDRSRCQSHSAAGMIVLERVLDQVLSNDADEASISAEGQMLRNLRVDREIKRLGQSTRVIDHSFQEFSQIELLTFQFKPTRVGSREQKQVI